MKGDVRGCTVVVPEKRSLFSWQGNFRIPPDKEEAEKNKLLVGSASGGGGGGR